MSTFERPAPDLAKIAEAWSTWTTDPEALPGRTMADLKIGGADIVLATIADETGLEILRDAWTLWDRGKATPEDTLSDLTEAGFADVVAALPGS